VGWGGEELVGHGATPLSAVAPNIEKIRIRIS
jgi:hypothetical protein